MRRQPKKLKNKRTRMMKMSVLMLVQGILFLLIGFWLGGADTMTMPHLPELPTKAFWQ
ncbi:hypothetical protein ACE3MZ_13740 [Paenibacillus sp. WLX1005]|uniref:hypothetical protein n=1 Tax=unclassified Paenibacillus TaxID=185978 RepID=UPI0039841112